MAKITYEIGDYVELYDDITLNTHLNGRGIEGGHLVENCKGGWKIELFNGEIVFIEDDTFRLR